MRACVNTADISCGGAVFSLVVPKTVAFKAGEGGMKMTCTADSTGRH